MLAHEPAASERNVQKKQTSYINSRKHLALRNISGWLVAQHGGCHTIGDPSGPTLLTNPNRVGTRGMSRLQGLATPLSICSDQVSGG